MRDKLTLDVTTLKLRDGLATPWLEGENGESKIILTLNEL